jgi:hypothetical protein
MMLIHSRKALGNRPYRFTQELQEFPITLEEVLPSGSNIFQDKIAEQLTKLKTMVKKPDGRALRVYHVA